ncbi:MAG: hypothetical protein WC307_02370 [Candidatus Nanoarchaeia archaeon]|jgi:hypothetical protein
MNNGQYKPKPDVNHKIRESNDHKLITNYWYDFNHGPINLAALMGRRREQLIGMLRLDEVRLIIINPYKFINKNEFNNIINDSMKEPLFDEGYFSFLKIVKKNKQFELRTNTFTQYNTIDSVIIKNEDDVIIKVNKIKDLNQEQLINTTKFQLKKSLIIDYKTLNNLFESTN